MKTFLWLLSICLGCSLLAAPAKKAAPKKAPAPGNVLAAKVTVDSATPAEVSSKIIAAVAQNSKKKVKLQIQLPAALQKDKKKKSYKLKNVPATQVLQVFCKQYQLEYSLKGTAVTFKPVKAAAKKTAAAEEPVSWRFRGPFRIKYLDKLRKKADYCRNLQAVQAELKKKKYNWDPKKFKKAEFTRKGSNGELTVTGDEASLRELQEALGKAFSNEIRTLTYVNPPPKED